LCPQRLVLVAVAEKEMEQKLSLIEKMRMMGTEAEMILKRENQMIVGRKTWLRVEFASW
jgi:hypothetical protein